MGAQTSNCSHEDKFCLSCFFSSSLCSKDSVDDRSPSDDLFHISKKHRVSTMHFNQDRLISSSPQMSVVSRIRQYPQPTQNLKREVHAPHRKPKFFSSNSGRGTHSKDDWGSWRNSLFRGYEKSKSLAFGTFQRFKKDKVIIDLESEASKDTSYEDFTGKEIQNLVSSDDSSVEEIDLEPEASKDTSYEDLTVKEIQNLISSDDSSVEEIEILSDGEEGRGQSELLDQRSLEGTLMQGTYANVTSYRYPGSSNRGLKVEDVGKMLESMSVHNGVEDLGLLPRQKLLKSAEKQNSRLNELAFDINLNVEKLSLASKPAKKPKKEIFRELFCLLTEEEDADVTAAFSCSNRRETLVTHQASNIEITGQILQCLRPGGWLNDEVINLYLELLKEREEREPNKFLKCHFFNTFFYRKLISGSHGYDFKAIRRWTTQGKIGYGLIECDKIFVPIHKQTHWCLAVINRKDKKFQYLDSLKGMDTQVLEVLARYYVDEVKDKSAQDIDVSSWEYECVHDLPEQENGFDCGMFLLKYTDFYSRGLTLFFGQKHMPYFRRRTAKEILKLKAE